ncbi:MAG: beta-galactosidase, partial [Firmicutes bacterium]|nr:beta-galactosidase [Bacillota bacterium]
MGRRDPNGTGLWIDNTSFVRDGTPFIPVMGEFHFSRYPAELWRKELLKIKASGITVISTYVFWNHHEEIQGQFDWRGSRNLRAFVEEVKSCGLDFWLRIGPWVHGEARYGGFPDWIQALPEVRANSEPYINFVDRFYGEIARQVEGLSYDDGGPIIGIQLENEYGEQGPGKGKEHMLRLKALAISHGMDAPFWSATGWPGGTVPEDEMLPMFAWYPEQPWVHHAQELEPDQSYFFHPCLVQQTQEPNPDKGYVLHPCLHVNSIGSELPGEDARPEADIGTDWPYMTCEIGGGNQVTWQRRHALSPSDITAIAFCMLGSGNILPAYYMYHGGTNPDGFLSTLQESQETGYPCDVPVKSYDFQAPLSEYGESRPHLNQFRRMHLFIETFGNLLARADTVIPGGAPEDTKDTHALRWAVRHDGLSGFVFVNTYQRHTALEPQTELTFALAADGLESPFVFPFAPFTFPSGQYAAFPFNIDLGGVKLRHATCQPLTYYADGKNVVWYFYAPDGILPELAFYAEGIVSVASRSGKVSIRDGFWVAEGILPGADAWIDIALADGSAVSICVLDERSSLDLHKFDFNGQRSILLTSADVWQDGETLNLTR